MIQFVTQPKFLNFLTLVTNLALKNPRLVLSPSYLKSEPPLSGTPPQQKADIPVYTIDLGR